MVHYGAWLACSGHMCPHKCEVVVAQQRQAHRPCVYRRVGAVHCCVRLHVDVGFRFRGCGAWGWPLASSVAMPRMLGAKACVIALVQAGRADAGWCSDWMSLPAVWRHTRIRFHVRGEKLQCAAGLVAGPGQLAH